MGDFVGWVFRNSGAAYPREAKQLLLWSDLQLIARRWRKGVKCDREEEKRIELSGRILNN